MLAVRPTCDAVNPRVRSSRSRSAIPGDRDLDAVEDPRDAEGDDHPPVEPAPRQPVHPGRGTVLRVGLTPRTSAVVCPPSSRSRRVKAVKAAAKYPPLRRATRGTRACA